MVYRTAMETPVHYQWDSDSRLPLPDPGSAPNNCGPTSVANIAHFYRDGHLGIYHTRRLAVSDWTRATSVTEQKAMLEARGVPCLVGQWPVSSIRKTIAGGRQPMVLGLYMAVVPSAIRGHPFTGWHAVEALDVGTLNGVSGMYIRDPNFNRTFRADATNGRRFYPDRVIQRAFVDAHGWGLMPTKPKVVSAPSPVLTVGGLPVTFTSRYGWKAKILPGKPRRSGASTGASNYGSTTKLEGFPIWGEVVGEDLTKYGLPGGSRWFFGPQSVNGWKVVYIPWCDFTERNF